MKNTKKLSTLGLLGALSILLATFIHFPIFPSAHFLEYDPADIPILIAGFIYGPAWGILLTVAVSLVQGFTVSSQSGIIGILMHIISTGVFVLVSAFIYKRKKTREGAVISLVLGSVSMAIVMTLWNLLLTPVFMGAPMEMVLEMLIPVIIPFNLIKAGGNAIITFFVYKKVSSFIKNI